MNRDKKLYNLMIKNHPTIIGWFIHKGIVGRKDDGLYIIEQNEVDADTYPKYQLKTTIKSIILIMMAFEG